MKKMILLLSVLAIPLFAQQTESVDVRAILQKQIDAARQRDLHEQARKDSLEGKSYFGPVLPADYEKPAYFGPESEYCGPNEEVIINTNAFAVNDSVAKATQEAKNKEALKKAVNNPIMAKTENHSDLYWKFVVIGGFALAAFSFVFFRRFLKNRPTKGEKKLKNNIRILREENIFVKEQPELKTLRSKLLNSPVILNNHGKPLSEVARELNISQGEIILAAKIKSYELAKGNNSKWFLN
jgi:hypothetical protein